MSSLAHSEILTTHVEIEQQFLNNIFPMESFLAAIIISFNETTIKEQKLLGTQNHQDTQHISQTLQHLEAMSHQKHNKRRNNT